jgi:hypothetical protein
VRDLEVVTDGAVVVVDVVDVVVDGFSNAIPAANKSCFFQNEQIKLFS